MTLGQYIAEQRKRAQLNQTQLGELVALSQSQVSRIELGESQPSIRQLVALSEALGFDLAEAVKIPVKLVA